MSTFNKEAKSNSSEDYKSLLLATVKGLLNPTTIAKGTLAFLLTNSLPASEFKIAKVKGA